MNECTNSLSVEIVLIRGLPGSGKSTLARTMQEHIHIEADMFMEVEGVYVYDAAKIRGAHDWCVASAKQALESGKKVVVSNTFVKTWELQRYIDLGYPYRIIELDGKWPNIHGVPKDKIEIMAGIWQQLPEIWKS
jgi:predicted kinase